MQRLFVFWLWLCVVPPSSPSCSTGSPAQCQKAGLVPGSNLAGEGFDVVTMERKRVYVIDVETWEIQPNNSCTLCTNLCLGNKSQRVPRAVMNWQALPQGKMQFSSAVYDSSEEFVNNSMNQEDPNWMKGLHLNLSSSLMVGGTHSKLAKMAMQKSKQDKYSFIQQDVHCTYYSYQLKQDPPLHKEFKQSLKRLPALYNNNTKAEYWSLLNTYGTHFIKKVNLGGRVNSVTSLRLCQMALNGYTETEVKDCLDAEASKNVKNVKSPGKPDNKFCKKVLKQQKNTFHNMFHDRVTNVEGGEIAISDLLFPNTPTDFRKWADSLKTTPGVVSYSLDPLHVLVNESKSKKQGLKKAVEDYILEHALNKNCSGKCSGGSEASKHDSCNCICQKNKYINSRCCPLKKDLAQLTVKVLSAKDLWGDVFDKTDAFVKISFGNKTIQTKVIQENDSPVWNSEFSFGMVILSSGMKLRLQVWDEDKMWYKMWDDKLGECTITPEIGNHSSICPLNHGTLYYSYTVQCAPWLGGPTCNKYTPTPMTSGLASPDTSRIAASTTSSFLMDIRKGHPVNPLLFVGPKKEKKVPYDIHSDAIPELK